jgi:hypothetical protein
MCNQHVDTAVLISQKIMNDSSSTHLAKQAGVQHASSAECCTGMQVMYGHYSIRAAEQQCI